VLSTIVLAGDQNAVEHHTENQEEHQTGMDNNDNGNMELNQARPQERPTCRGPVCDTPLN